MVSGLPNNGSVYGLVLLAGAGGVCMEEACSLWSRQQLRSWERRDLGPIISGAPVIKSQFGCRFSIAARNHFRDRPTRPLQILAAAPKSR